MGKHTGITIRIGATQDSVTVSDATKGTIVFDRAQMRLEGHGKEQGALRRIVVEAWAKARAPKASRKAFPGKTYIPQLQRAA